MARRVRWFAVTPSLPLEFENVLLRRPAHALGAAAKGKAEVVVLSPPKIDKLRGQRKRAGGACLLYTSDAADE